MCHVHHTEHKFCLVNSRETNESCPHSAIIMRGSSRENGNLVREGKRKENFKGNSEKKEIRTADINICFQGRLFIDKDYNLLCSFKEISVQLGFGFALVHVINTACFTKGEGHVFNLHTQVISLLLFKGK